MPDREKVIKGLECCSRVKFGDSLFNDKMCNACPYSKPLGCGHDLAKDAFALLKEQEALGGWISADKRPPKQGRYLVWGLTRITPDHYDEANGFWEIQPAFWFEKSGGDRKVKFWQTLPEPPEEVSGDA